MNKVMTRAQHRPGTRPPARRDPRRPGATPPRTPSGGTPRTATPEGRPPASPPRTNTSPTDNRPPTPSARTATGSVHTGGPTTGSVRTSRTSAGSPSATRTPSGSAPAGRTTADAIPAAGRPAPATRTTAPTRPLDAPVVPAQTPRRPVPQLSPTDHFAELLLAVLSGQRPVHSMLRHTVGQAYDELAELAERGPLRTRGTRPVVRDIGYYVPRDGALEAFARIGAGDQLRAMAFRLEQGQDLRWRCTAVELGGPRRSRAADD
ncbi:Rv3235 family protein [Streptomyces sp. S.PB5]|uniref:Rv3235 family protein n=1 Tax=Streptomyces sp. S.PB5 TaxID=3020844 RepID=UPI0025B26D54|nr:Rv3235 family protein [Streptomyces sp. S.PB5]MDN3028709.1 Rv3235 family protein [Streptomyces sp. S.PB5]